MRAHSIFVAIVIAAAGCGAPNGKSNVTGSSNSATNSTDAGGSNSSAGSNNGTGTFDPGVPGDTGSDELSDDERARICAELGRTTDDLGLTESDCMFTAYALAGESEAADVDELRAACQEALDRCVEQSSGLPAGGYFCSPAISCTGTVEQAVACIIDAAEGQIRATDTLPGCDQVTFDTIGQAAQLQLPPSPPCAQFNATCETN